jgi:hypothetical protein
MVSVFTSNLPALDQGVVHVVLFMHNEDNIFTNLTEEQTRAKYMRHRNGLIEFAQMLQQLNVPFCWESDWVFLKAVFEYDTPTVMTSTNNKNLVRYLSEDLGMTIEPHSHEHYGYNYTDVAHLIDSLGVEPTDVIGGHIYDPYNEKFQNWERFRQPLAGQQFPHAVWKGNILMGSGTPDHTYDPAPSGVWRPKNKYEYWQDDPNGNIMVVGQYTGDVDGVQELVDLYQSGTVSPNKMLTASIHIPQNITPDFNNQQRTNIIDPLLEMQDRGEIKLVTFTELIKIWKTQYNSQAYIYNPGEITVPSSFSTFVPSIAAGDTGIFIQITLPTDARYQNAFSPVVVNVPGGWDALGVDPKSSQQNEQGLIQIWFNFPGGGVKGQESGGLYDERGENCIRAVTDVTKFAMGKIPDIHGHYLAEMTGDIKPLYRNTGLCGWSNGGNATLVAAGAMGDELEDLGWIVNWESPVGDGMPNVEAGRPGKLNPAYNPDTGEFDLILLAYSPALTVEGYSGGLYFDIDNNNTLDPEQDFVVNPHPYNDKMYYSSRIRQAASRLGAPLPNHIATEPETNDFWMWRNGELWIEKVVQHNPDLMFLVEAGDKDHVQGAIDHPHILIQYLGFLNVGARFVRLNPDRSYIEQVFGHAAPQATDNDAFAVFDHITIRTALNPRGQGGIPNSIAVIASQCELADRTQFNDLRIQMDSILTGIRTSTYQSPEKIHLEQNHPNPFNTSTTIRLFVPKTTTAALKIYNILGRSIKTWNLNQTGVEITRNWDGRDEHGNNVASGLYFYVLHTDSGHQIIKKMHLIK